MQLVYKSQMYQSVLYEMCSAALMHWPPKFSCTETRLFGREMPHHHDCTSFSNDNTNCDVKCNDP